MAAKNEAAVVFAKRRFNQDLGGELCTCDDRYSGQIGDGFRFTESTTALWLRHVPILHHRYIRRGTIGSRISRDLWVAKDLRCTSLLFSLSHPAPDGRSFVYLILYTESDRLSLYLSSPPPFWSFIPILLPSTDAPSMHIYIL